MTELWRIVTTARTGELDSSWRAIPDPRGAGYEINLRAGAEGFVGRWRLELPLPAAMQQDQPPWFCLPGFWYGQGRDDARLAYPALGEADGEWTAPAWDFALDRAASPLLLAHHDEQWFGFAWDPHYQLQQGANGRGATVNHKLAVAWRGLLTMTLLA